MYRIMEFLRILCFSSFIYWPLIVENQMVEDYIVSEVECIVLLLMQKDSLFRRGAVLIIFRE